MTAKQSLIIARDTFRMYEMYHKSKNSIDKAQRNHDLANTMEKGLEEFSFHNNRNILYLGLGFAAGSFLTLLWSAL